MAGIRRPLIGITTYPADRERRFASPAAYARAIRRAGGAVALLPPGAADVPRWLAAVDGLVLTGGGDLAPSRYGGKPHPKIYLVDRERDATDLALARAAVRRDLPLLAICRGMQVLNVSLGGTLHPHLPDAVGSRVLHRRPPRRTVTHRITVEPGSRLAGILGRAACRVVSWHHQAVRAVAPALRVVARADDGVIEAVEHPGSRWLAAVQWHPELMADSDRRQQRLFDGLVNAARRGRSRRTSG